MKQSISVIIAILNEERTIATIVETVLTWGKAKELIVVDDEASTDDSKGALKQFGKRVTYMRNKKGIGKSEAMYDGIKKSTGSLLMILDGDMTNLTHSNLDAMTDPVAKGTVAMSIGVPRFWKAGAFEPWNDVSGTRVLRRDILMPHLEKMRTTAYGVEVFLNGLYEKDGIERVRLPYVYVFNKWAKKSIPEAIEEYIREGRDLLQQTLVTQSNEITPKVRELFELALTYLKRALEYLQ